MTHPDYEQAMQYALGRLEHELPATLTYHSLAHTRDDVLPAVVRLAADEGVAGDELLLLRTAACFHDIGFIEERNGHELIGMRIAGEVLPGFGFEPPQIAIISGIILATRVPQAPQTLLERLMADADLDVLGREDFLEVNQLLRDELMRFDMRYSNEEWYDSQITFLVSHSYWTQAAHLLRDAQKQYNLEQLLYLRGCLEEE